MYGTIVEAEEASDIDWYTYLETTEAIATDQNCWSRYTQSGRNFSSFLWQKRNNGSGAPEGITKRNILNMTIKSEIIFGGPEPLDMTPMEAYESIDFNDICIEWSSCPETWFVMMEYGGEIFVSFNAYFLGRTAENQEWRLMAGTRTVLASIDEWPSGSVAIPAGLGVDVFETGTSAIVSDLSGERPIDLQAESVEVQQGSTKVVFSCISVEEANADMTPGIFQSLSLGSIPVDTDVTWFDDRFSRRKKIVVRKENVVGSPTYIPVRAMINSGDDVVAKNMVNSGGSVLVVDSEGDTLPVEAIHLSKNHEDRLCLYFMASNLSNTTDNEFYIYYAENDKVHTGGYASIAIWKPTEGGNVKSYVNHFGFSGFGE